MFLLGLLKYWCLTFFRRKIFASLSKLAILFKARIKTKKSAPYIRIQSITWLKLYDEFNTRKGIEPEKKMIIEIEKRCTN